MPGSFSTFGSSEHDVSVKGTVSATNALNRKVFCIFIKFELVAEVNPYFTVECASCFLEAKVVI